MCLYWILFGWWCGCERAWENSAHYFFIFGAPRIQIVFRWYAINVCAFSVNQRRESSMKYLFYAATSTLRTLELCKRTHDATYLSVIGGIECHMVLWYCTTNSPSVSTRRNHLRPETSLSCSIYHRTALSWSLRVFMVLNQWPSRAQICSITPAFSRETPRDMF